MMYPKKDNTLSMIGGAALGALAMYLLDPDSGQRRRQRVAETTHDAAHRASGAIGPAWDRVSDTARAWGATAAEKLSEKYSDASEATTDTAHSLGDTLADKFHNARKQARKAAAVPASWFHREEPSHIGAYTATGLGTMLLGAGAMYLFDPQRGRDRRNRLIEQATSVVNRTGRTCQRLGRDLTNRAKGYAHGARGMFESEDAVSADQLLARIRSELGHVVSHASAIQVMTDNHGRVTLHGKVLASEADKMLSTVKGIGGVNEVINLLSVKETEQQLNEVESNSGAGKQRVQQL